MDYFYLFIFLAIVIIIIYFLLSGGRDDFGRRMSVGAEKAHRFFDDTSRRFSQIRFSNVAETLRRRASQGYTLPGIVRHRSGSVPSPQGPTTTEEKTSEASPSETDGNVNGQNNDSTPFDASPIQETTEPQDVDENQKSDTEDDHSVFEQKIVTNNTSSPLKPISEEVNLNKEHVESDPMILRPLTVHTNTPEEEPSPETRQKKTVPTGSVVPMIKLDVCPAEESTRQTSKAVSFVSNEEIIGPLSTYNTVSPRRMSLKPGNVPFHQKTVKRGSVMVPSQTVSPSIRRNSLLVQPQGYVCPRRTSVLFASDIFAHSPRRRSSTCARNLIIPETASALSKRFFLPRKSIIKNVIRSSWSAVKGSGNGVSNLRTGIRATINPSGSYYPHRRRSSLSNFEGFKSSTTSEGLASRLPSLADISGSLARRRSMLKRMIKAPFQGETLTDGTKNEESQKRRDSRAGLSYFRRRSLFGRRQSTHIPKQKGNYLTGNLTEFKTVFGPNAHEVLTEKFRKHGPLYEITALGQRTVFLFDHRDIEHVRKAEGKYPKHMDFKHLRLYRQRNDLPFGMLLSTGEEWRQQRKILSKILLGAVPMSRFVPVVNKVSAGVIEIISKNLADDGLFLPEEDIGNYVIEAFGRILYGRDLHCLEKGQPNELHQFVKTAKSNFNDAKKLMILPTCLMLLHPAWRRQNERWNNLLETTVHQVRLSTDPGQKRNSFSVISQIFASGEMTQPEILVNLTDILHASIDTTSNVILWCLYEMSRHPESQDKVVEEFKNLGCQSNTIKFQELKELSYLKAVVKESLRLHPVGFLTCRTVSKPVFIRQYNIPPKSTVAAAMYVMGRNSDLTYEPDSFIPERWLTGDPKLESFYNTVPFGFGPRACLGRRVAEVEVTLFLLHLCLHFRIRMKKPEVICHQVKLLLVPEKELELVLENRE